MASNTTYYGECRCCLTNASLKNMWEQYENKRMEIEIYGKMLMDCFSISWTIHDRVEDDQICDICIGKLQYAVQFKKQVMKSQQILMERSTAKDAETSENEDTCDKEEERSYHIERNVVEKMERKPKKQKYAVIEDVSRDQKLKNMQKPREPSPAIEEDLPKDDEVSQEFLIIKEEDEDRDFENVEFLEDELAEMHKNNVNKDGIREYEPKTKKPKFPAKDIHLGTKRKNLSMVVQNNQTIAKEVEIDGTENSEGKAANTTDTNSASTVLDKHRDNIRSILIASNATPIRGYWGGRYSCYYCPAKFKFPKDLKQHTFSHEDTPFKFKVKNIAEHVVKLDITFLHCNICDTKIHSLKHLMEHIRDVHEMPIHFGIPNHIMPFNFEKDVMTCALCPNEFEDFKSLFDHVNGVHCRNYECNECHQGFVNIRLLKTHSIRHGIGIFACMQCAKVFNTRLKLFDHEMDGHRSESTVLADVEKCIKEEPPKAELFADSFKCTECSESFDRKQDLKNHILNKHLNPSKQQIYQCPYCPNLYTQPKLLKEHLRTHNESSKFTCEVCEKQFDKLDCYTEHMKDNHGLEA